MLRRLVLAPCAHSTLSQWHAQTCHQARRAGGSSSARCSASSRFAIPPALRPPSFAPCGQVSRWARVTRGTVFWPSCTQPKLRRVNHNIDGRSAVAEWSSRRRVLDSSTSVQSTDEWSNGSRHVREGFASFPASNDFPTLVTGQLVPAPHNDAPCLRALGTFASPPSNRCPPCRRVA